MTLDLDDLPPRIARQLAELADGEDLVLVRNGALVARLCLLYTSDAADE